MVVSSSIDATLGKGWASPVPDSFSAGALRTTESPALVNAV